MRYLSIILLLLSTFVLPVPAYCQQIQSAWPADELIKLTSDGWEIYGELRIPKADKPVPGVVLLHEAYGTRQEYVELADQLAKRGIASFRVDLRAHGESINKGKFAPPFDEAMRAYLKGTERDVTVVANYLKSHPKIDGDRIGFVGASYSGERMAKSGRMDKYGKAYVALSPGDFSDESIEAIDKSSVPWFFVRSFEERDFFNPLFDAIRKKAKTAQILELPGSHHAARILEHHPEMAEMIAVWLNQKL